MTEHQPPPAAVAVAELRPFASFRALLVRELRLAVRRPADMLNPVFFFAVVVTLFPLAIEPLPATLRVMGPGVVWVALLLAALLPLTSLFGQDFDDGTLEQYVLAGQSLTSLCIAKTVALWIVAVVPLVLVSTLVAYSYRLPAQVAPVLMLTLSLGGYSVCAIGAVAAGLTVGVQRANALIALLVLPLMVPVLIFGARAVSLAAGGNSLDGAVYMLAATFVLVAFLAPLATATALRISLE